MLDQIETILQNACRLVRGRLIVVGVSGGPDSLCLLQLLHQAGYPVLVAHFNHQLRPEAADEAVAVEKLAARLGLRCVVGSADVSAHAQENGLSIEEAARALRYDFLFKQARQAGAQAVAVGHNADDQVETVLMHFLRGAGLNGLQGMGYRTVLRAFDPAIPIVRPLFGSWREEILAYCTAHNLQPHFDPSNASPDYLRNRLRHTLIPTLETYNPKFREAAWRAAQTLSDDHSLLQTYLDETWDASVLEQDKHTIVFDGPKLTSLPLPLRRHLVRRAVETLQPGLESSYATLERGAAFLGDPARTTQVDLTGGLRLLREGARVYVAAGRADLPAGQWPQMPTDMSALGITSAADVALSSGWHFSAGTWPSVAEARDRADRNGDLLQVWLDAETLPDSLELRVLRPGDRFEPLGMAGHSQKLSDFFVNEKLPQRARGRWPLLCSGPTVIWVPGFRPADAFRLRPDSQKVLHFAVSPPEADPA